jgi:hypothetical protein
MELGNVISFWSYQEAESSESLHEWGRMIHARACGRELVQWIFSRFELSDPLVPGTNVNGKVDIFWQYLVHHAQLLVAYKQQAVDNNMDWNGPGSCEPADVKSAVHCSLAHEPVLLKMYVMQEHKSMTFAWPGPIYAVRKRSSPLPLKGLYMFSHFQLFNCLSCLQGLIMATQPMTGSILGSSTFPLQTWTQFQVCWICLTNRNSCLCIDDPPPAKRRRIGSK